MDTQYFAHDYDARRDIKMIRLRKEMGYEGVGIYWSLIEFLYENGNRCLADDIAAVADELHTDEEKLRRVVEDFDLFTLEEGAFFSESIARRLGKRKEVSDKRSSAAARRRDKRGEESAAAAEIDSVAEIVEKTDKEDAESSETVCNDFADDLQDVCRPFARRLQDVCNDFAGENKKEKEKDNNTPLPPKGARPRKQVSSFDFEIETAPEWIAKDMADAFHDWILYKRRRRSPYADAMSAKRCYDRLMQWAGGSPETARQRIDTAIANNWQGCVFDNDRQTARRREPGAADMTIGQRMTKF
ncbi:MAG: DUF4373 domain-containing protein [Marinilabiliaceae bacterium]